MSPGLVEYFFFLASLLNAALLYRGSVVDPLYPWSFSSDQCMVSGVHIYRGLLSWGTRDSEHPTLWFGNGGFTSDTHLHEWVGSFGGCVDYISSLEG